MLHVRGVIPLFRYIAKTVLLTDCRILEALNSCSLNSSLDSIISDLLSHNTNLRNRGSAAGGAA